MQNLVEETMFVSVVMEQSSPRLSKPLVRFLVKKVKTYEKRGWFSGKIKQETKTFWLGKDCNWYDVRWQENGEWGVCYKDGRTWLLSTRTPAAIFDTKEDAQNFIETVIENNKKYDGDAAIIYHDEKEGR